MANTRSKRKTTGRSQTVKRKSKTQIPSAAQRFQRDILLVLFFGAAVLMFISNLGLGGFVGNAISTGLFGSLGLFAYVFPFLFFFCVLFLEGNKGNRLAYKKTFFGIVLCADICGMIQHLTDGYLASMTLADYFARGADYHTGGGAVGGAVCISTISAFGAVGSYVILIMMLLICLIEITQRSFFGFFHYLSVAIHKMLRGGRELYVERQPEREMRKELRDRERARRREERRQARIEELERALAEDEDEDDEAEETEEVEKTERVPRRHRRETPSFVAPVISAGHEEDPDEDEMDIIRLNPKDPVIEKKPKHKRRKVSAVSEDSDPELVELRAARQRLEERKKKEPVKEQAEVLSDPFMDDDDDDDDEEFSFSIQRPEPSILRDESLQEEDFEDLYTKEADDMQRGAASSAGRNVQDSEETMVEGEPGSQPTPTPRQPQRNPRSSKEEMESGVRNIENEIQQIESIPVPKYHYPPLKLLKRGNGKNQGDSDEHLAKTAKKLQETLRNFGVNVTVTNVSCGPTVTQYELQPEMGVKVSRIVSLADDIKLNLAAADIRIEAPIPGKAAVGIEVPNKENSPVMLRDLLSSQEFQGASSKLSFAVGKDIAGKPVVTDISKMPHLLIAGSTGSGKSVCINTLIASILYKASPEEVKLIMIDPKVVELSVYNGIPHLLIPVVTDPKKAAGALNWAVQEMTQRYNTFAEFSVRKLEEYNNKVENMVIPEGQERPKKMPQIVVIVDELADLMMVAPGEVEDAIVRLTQLARAAGIHLVIATQRPSVNVITGLIKANMPSRIAFAVSSGTDSRVILDTNGAEKLLGKGDMLFYPQGYPKPARLQGAFISDEEVSALVEFLAEKNPKAQYNSAIEEQVNTAVSIGGGGASGASDRDVYFEEAGKFIIEKEKASIGMLQRMFKIGFNRAARIMDQLSDAGVVGPEEGTKPRKVLMSQSEFETYLEEH